MDPLPENSPTSRRKTSIRVKFKAARRENPNTAQIARRTQHTNSFAPNTYERISVESSQGLRLWAWPCGQGWVDWYPQV